VLVPLSRRYSSVAPEAGPPHVDQIDTAVFERTYFTHCMSCTFCHDVCCSYGADIDLPTVERVMAHREALEAYVGAPASEWFTEEVRRDPELPGGAHRRTKVRGDRCVFLNRGQRGCGLHSFALSNGLDYHQLKPMVCSLFAITFNQGVLHLSNELVDESLVCLGDGPTVYEAVRDELHHYFGPELVAELDGLRARLRGS
jgi:Fe-S-cluster containining protein